MSSKLTTFGQASVDRSSEAASQYGDFRELHTKGGKQILERGWFSAAQGAGA
jgi:hypothetical protein